MADMRASGAGSGPARPQARQCAGAVFMVNPASFRFNEQTAQTNALQQAASGDEATVNAAARAESDALARALRSEGVRVCVVEDSPVPVKPDALFPNNWISFHEDGTLVLYPLQAGNRRLERRPAVVEEVCAVLGFQPRRRLDLTPHEASGRFLEGTGSLVLDHVGRVAYACRSARTDASLVREWARLMAYEPIVFDATDAQGRRYYHTNVMLWIGTRCAAVCSAAITPADRRRVREALEAGGREVLDIDHAAVAGFAGNMLELATWDEALGDASVLVMSTTARAALSGALRRRLSGCVDTVLAVPVPTIERVGGGGVRCMLAEVPEVVA